MVRFCSFRGNDRSFRIIGHGILTIDDDTPDHPHARNHVAELLAAWRSGATWSSLQHRFGNSAYKTLMAHTTPAERHERNRRIGRKTKGRKS